MQYTVPHYYKKFSCTGSACPDTCCAGWQIQIDPASLKRYRHTEGPIGNRLRNEINWRKRSFRQYKGRCAFLNEMMRISAISIWKAAERGHSAGHAAHIPGTSRNLRDSVRSLCRSPALPPQR